MEITASARFDGVTHVVNWRRISFRLVALSGPDRRLAQDHDLPRFMPDTVAVGAAWFSMPVSTCVPSCQSLQVTTCMRVAWAGITELILLACCTRQAPSPRGRYLPCDQATDLVSMPLKPGASAPNA